MSKAKTKYVTIPSRTILPERDVSREPVLECVNLGIKLSRILI